MKRLASAALFFFAFAGTLLAQNAAVLQLRTRLALPNVDGRIDHLSVDLPGRRLFLAALGNHTIEVIDLRAERVVNTIRELAEPQGVLYDPASGRLFVASASDGTLKLFDGATFQLLTTVPLSSDADNVRYDRRGQRVIVGHGDGALAIVDRDGNKVGDVALDAHPESFQVEGSGARVYVNVPGRREIQVADLQKGSVLARWPVTAALKNYPMALDETHHRLLIGCRSPARMLAIDTGTGKVVQSVAIIGDTDDLFYDADRRQVYVIGGAGRVDTFQQKDPDHYERISGVPIPTGARTGLFVPEWKQLFVAVPHRGEQRAEVLVYDVK